MPEQAPPVPVAMVFTGSDPAGGAGLQADIEVLASLGCHTTPVVTNITVQNTTEIDKYYPVSPTLVIEQARAVLEDINVHAFKVGMIGSEENVTAIHTLLTEYPDIPVILDPLLASSSGGALADGEIITALRTLLCPLATVITPNSNEASQLAPDADNLEACAQEIMSLGADFVLLTGAHEPTAAVVNHLYGSHRLLDTFSWERLPYSYHGAGCTLSAAITGLIAQGIDPITAVHQAQQYTWKSLVEGYRIGLGQHVPNRLFWASEALGIDKSEG